MTFDSLANGGCLKTAETFVLMIPAGQNVSQPRLALDREYFLTFRDSRSIGYPVDDFVAFLTANIRSIPARSVRTVGVSHSPVFSIASTGRRLV